MVLKKEDTTSCGFFFIYRREYIELMFSETHHASSLSSVKVCAYLYLSRLV